MNRKTFFAILSVFIAADLAAHDPSTAHRAYTTKGADLLTANDYSELTTFGGRMEDGSAEEDPAFTDYPLASPNSRPMTHFFNPFEPTFQLLSQNTALQYAEPNLWQKAIEKYSSGEKSLAYYFLGRSVHIIEDMTSPPHVQSDPHLSFGDITEKIFQSGTYELWEKLNWSSLSTASGSAPRQGVNFYTATLDRIAQETNMDSRIDGLMQRSSTQPATGIFATLFPNIQYASGIDPETGEPFENWCEATLGCNFSGPERNDPLSGDDWWRTLPLSGNFIYVESAGAARPAVWWDTLNQSFVPNGNFVLVQIWEGIPSPADPTRVLDNIRATPSQTGHIIPRTVEAVAGVMQLFAKTVDPLAPQITFKDTSGNVIPNNGATNSSEVLVEATDPVDANHPTASGIYKIVLSMIGDVHRYIVIQSKPSLEKG
jgi:hypothetical protein